MMCINWELVGIQQTEFTLESLYLAHLGVRPTEKDQVTRRNDLKAKIKMMSDNDIVHLVDKVFAIAKPIVAIPSDREIEINFLKSLKGDA